MGKLILCSGARAQRPYLISQMGVRIYSIEELCYCLYQYVYLIEEDMFCDALFDFIENDLMLPERAQKLRLLKKQKADIKTIVTVILCSADYYTENEIKGLLKQLDEIIGMPMVKRSCIKAGRYLSKHQYSKAAAEYERIINSREAVELTPEEYGDLYHNLAVAKLHTTGLKEATELFHQAYERNQREESLIQYLMALRLSNNEDEYQRKAQEYQIGSELDYKIRQYYEDCFREAEQSTNLQEIHHLREMKARGSETEFYARINEIISSWMEQVRQS